MMNYNLGNVCKLQLFVNRDRLIGRLEFSTSCAKYIVKLDDDILKEECTIGLKQTHFTIPITNHVTMLFYLMDDLDKTLFEDKAGIIELAPNEIDTKLFSCDINNII